MGANPYLLDRPAVVSFSGGRTSGYMLRHVLDAFGGVLPSDVKVVFANTGKERPETLDFVERCSQRWGVPVAWLEYRYDGGHRVVTVDYATASRNGEPFEAVVRYRQFLPNPVMRFCTAELKVRSTFRFVRSLGWAEYENAVGLRYDEPRRVAKATNPPAKSRQKGEQVVCPLHAARVMEGDVLAWWKAQAFDLALESHEGNCDLCFLKGRDKLARIMRERPDLAAWWVGMEQQIKRRERPETARFRADRPSYGQMLKQVQEQPNLPFAEEERYPECRCTD